MDFPKYKTLVKIARGALIGLEVRCHQKPEGKYIRKSKLPKTVAFVVWTIKWIATVSI